MVLVCLSHVRVYFADSAPALYFIVTTITRLATPTFLLLSGFVAAYVLTSGRSNARIALFDRALFVLIVGHFLLDLNELRSIEAIQWIFGRVTITDAIAICLMSAVVLHRLPAVVLALLGAALAALSWPIAMTVTVESPVARHLGAVLFDLRTEASALIDAAIVPYLGVFLIGMALSKRSYAELKNARFDAVARRLAPYGIAAIVIVSLGVLSWIALKSAGLTPSDPATSEVIQAALDPRSKMPPGPAYLLFYGGGGLLIAALCLVARPRAIMRPLVDWAATLGRASLMCFVVQDWLLKLVPGILQFDDFNSVTFWLLYFCCVLLFIHWLASRWDANRANRFLTVGLKNLAHKPAARIR